MLYRLGNVIFVLATVIAAVIFAGAMMIDQANPDNGATVVPFIFAGVVFGFGVLIRYILSGN